MKLKLTLGLALLLVAALLVGGLGCNKTTGGGWFYNLCGGEKISFGFNAIPIDTDDDDIPDAAKGQFQLIDHGDKTKIHGTFENVLFSVDEFVTIFEGECTIKGEGTADLVVTLTDFGEGANEWGPGDAILIVINPPGSGNTIIYAGFLDGGNIQIHKK